MTSILKQLSSFFGFAVMRRNTWREIARTIDLGQLIHRSQVDVLTLAIEQIHDPAHPFFFMQVGANDGNTDDPIGRAAREFGWAGILVEPQPEAFERLRQNYACVPDLIFENVAIASDRRSITLYRFVCPKSGDRPRDLFAAADREQLVRARAKNSWTYDIEEVAVPAMRVDDVLRKHGITNIDLLVIDTEGMDFDVIRTLDFDRVAPRIIQFEHIHLSASDLESCVSLLESHGYQFAARDRDIVAILGDRSTAATTRKADLVSSG